MPLYRMLCISAHYPDFSIIKQLVTQSATHVLENGGAVRSIQSLGTRVLPQRMHSHKNWHYNGDYWTISFDAPPTLMWSLVRRLRADPRVVRSTTLKLGERLEDIAGPSSVSAAMGGQTVKPSLTLDLPRTMSQGIRVNDGVSGGSVNEWEGLARGKEGNGGARGASRHGGGAIYGDRVGLGTTGGRRNGGLPLPQGSGSLAGHVEARWQQSRRS